ncbi:hypothetical protein CES85_5707 [Ochrobactrum quorumnocens]|uniref:Uncharacterized protein n=1 Tax=Ochrobactrum quorumnocens TaxID=271865 RepID=A0A248UDK9_9HYPH|nr:hypothetical protein CES85_5707 [[Ochrobactrum] quorumnocens]
MRLERHSTSVSHETIYQFAHSADGHAVKLAMPDFLNAALSTVFLSYRLLPLRAAVMGDRRAGI